MNDFVTFPLCTYRNTAYKSVKATPSSGARTMDEISFILFFFLSCIRAHDFLNVHTMNGRGCLEVFTYNILFILFPHLCCRSRAARGRLLKGLRNWNLIGKGAAAAAAAAANKTTTAAAAPPAYT